MNDNLLNSNWSDEFKGKALELNDLIQGLPIDSDSSNKLVSLIVECIDIAFKDAITLQSVVAVCTASEIRKEH